jgi:hypothetical protein
MLLDCRVCHRRRIKCDRSLPTCKKCAKKNIQCSGYGIALKWDQGVASRGKLAGRSIPLPPESIPVPDEPQVQDAAFVEQNITSIVQLPLMPSMQSFSSPPLESRNGRFLLHHYDQVVAANMTWADTSENPWRDIIVPMAIESPLVLLSVLTFAAKHVSAMAQFASLDEESRKAAEYSRMYGNQTLKLLAQELRLLTSADQTKSSTSLLGTQASQRYNSLLATMLVLCNVETVRPGESLPQLWKNTNSSQDSSVWRIHLNAARTVLASRAKELRVQDSADTATTFLKQELSTASTFASLTSFSLSKDEDFSTREPGGPFAEFLKLLHMVTRLERQAFQDPDSVHSFGISPDGFQQLFEHARARTLNLSTTLKFSPPEGRLQFNRIVNSFYHAGLIYSYRALFSSLTSTSSQPSLIESEITTSIAELFQILKPMEMDKPVFAQDLVWPLFIAGTEALETDEQDMVVWKLEQAMRRTGFSNCEQALEFLRALWAERANMRAKIDLSDSRMAIHHNWIYFAREWEMKGHEFWVF